MEELNGVTIYWLISIGLFVGFVIDIFLGKRGRGKNDRSNRGITMIGNLVYGAVGSVIIGVVMITLNVFGPLIYAALGSIAFLFLFNVFSFEHSHSEDAKAS